MIDLAAVAICSRVGLVRCGQTAKQAARTCRVLEASSDQFSHVEDLRWTDEFGYLLTARAVETV